jgi:dCMP deaminase
MDKKIGKDSITSNGLHFHKGLNFMDDIFMSHKMWVVKKSKYEGEYIEAYSDDVDSPFLYPDYGSKDELYLEMASVWSKNSHCSRMKVGCLIINNKSIISDGYNGSPEGFPNVCESDDNITLPYVLHAEANAITKLAKGTQSSIGSTLYVTLSPCYECSKLIIQSGIKKIVFSEVYRNPESIFFLIEAGIEVLKIDRNK